MKSELKKSSKTWTNEEIIKIENYTRMKSSLIISNVYINIILGYVKFRKPKDFFISLADIIGRSSKLCKSKFQKIEDDLFKNVLMFDTDTYKLFYHLKNKKPKRVYYDFKYIKKILNDNQNKSKNKQSFKMIGNNK